jgi:S1-C subfamily serine protease
MSQSPVTDRGGLPRGRSCWPPLRRRVGRGVGVVAVLPGSPSEQVGLRPRDVILQVNGVPVESCGEFCQVVWSGKVGDSFELIVRREEEDCSLTVRGGDRRNFLLSPSQERKP